MLTRLTKCAFGAHASTASRSGKYAVLQNSDLEYFKSLLGESGVITEGMDKYNVDEMKKFRGRANVALAPANTQQLQSVLRYCNEKRLAVVPQSGNTGLVGGSVPVHDEIVLSLAKLNKIHKFDENTSVLTADAGVVLEHANEYVRKFGFELPWDLGSKGSCMIGGNTATHAGGKYFVRYGPMRASILGMQVVLANGEFLDMSSEVRKDNSGIDLKQLFIGSEGSLGVITQLNSLCFPLEEERYLMLAKCDSYDSVLRVYKLARSVLGRNLAAIEWMDGWAFESVMNAYEGTNKRRAVSNPFTQRNVAESDFYVLIEASTSEHARALQERFTEELIALQGLKDCVRAESQSQYQELWSIREYVGPSVSETAQLQFKYDISLDIQKMQAITDEVRARAQLSHDKGYVVGYGHIGDSNLHINVALRDKRDADAVGARLEPFIFDYLRGVRGSISAEHGLGQMKVQYLPYQKSREQIRLMWDLKRLFDPNAILNPYKVFPEFDGAQW